MKRLLISQDVIDRIPAAIYICSAPSGQLVQSNRTASELLGYQPDLNSGIDLCSRFKTLVRNGAPLAHGGNPLKSVFEAGMSLRSVDGVFERTDGSYVKVIANIDPIRDESGKVIGAINIFQPVTRQLDAEAAETQLIHAQKLEAVGQLAEGVAHDFNNLLMVISGQAELLLESVVSSEVETRVGKILSATESAGLLTRKLIAFGRKQNLASSTFDLNQLVEEANGLAVHVLPKNVNFSARLSSSPCWVHADRAQIEQTLINLILNSRDAMPQGGKLVITTAAVSIDGSERGQYGDIPVGDYALITIADTGLGIPEQYMSRVFEPFFTTKQKGRGTGLGLSVAYGIIRQSGGHIRVVSTVGAGTTFSIYIPSASRVEIKEPIRHACPLGKSSASCPRQGTVLIVDDEEPIRTGLRAILENCGLTVLDCGDATEAARTAEELKGRLALLVTDIVMPKITGTELANSLVASRPDLPVVFMSGYAAGEIGCERFHQVKFLQKPFGRAKLLDAVCEGLRTCPLQHSELMQ
jgi:two-component system, cell cycle sensor histidine kinase and response regulator CckA